MFQNWTIAAALAISLSLTPVNKAHADNEAAIAAIIIGGLIGAAVISDRNKRRDEAAANQPNAGTSSTPTQPRAPTISPAQRAENRAVQESLNYFGYEAGVVDGIVGGKTRAAVRRYQEEMGYPVDGRLDAAEKEFLLESRQRADVAGVNAQYSEILALQGRDGLLKRYRDEELGVQPEVVARLDTTETTPSNGATLPLSIPSFETGDPSRSINQLCNEVNILTMANGGFATAGQVKDRDFALSEQFCLSRAHAISEGNKLTASLKSLDKSSVATECERLAEYMDPILDKVDWTSPDRALRQIQEHVQGSGQTKGELLTAGRVCLGTGYRVDNPRIALASTAILSVSGLPAYGEIFSHHLREGLGRFSPNRKAADRWLMATLDGLSRGETSVLGQEPDRAAILREALTGKVAANSNTSPNSSIPVFEVAVEN